MDFHTRPDVCSVPIVDIPPNEVCLAWDGSRRGALVREFVPIAVADAFAPNQPCTPAGARAELGWAPRHTGPLAELARPC